MLAKCGYWRAIILTLLLASSAVAQQGIPWQADLQAAKQQAAATNQLILVHCWAPWCGVCRRMEQEVLADPAVVTAMRGRYVPVKLNVDQHPDEAKRLGINALPTDVVITPDGQVVERYAGHTVGSAEYANRLYRAAAAPRRQTIPSQQPAMAANVAAPSGVRQIAPPGASQPPTVPQFANIPSGAAAPTWNAPPSNTPSPTAPALGNRPDLTSQAPQFGAIPNAAQPPQFAAQPPMGGWDPRANQAPATSSAAPSLPNPALPNPALAVQNPGPSVNAQTPPPAVQTPPMLTGAAGPSTGNMPDSLALAGPNLGNPPTSTPPPANAQAPAQPAGDMSLALDGYCPVTLVEGKEWKLGDRRWGAMHQGQTYLFTGQQQQQRFLADPDRYSPVASGNDVVLVLESGQTVAGRREHGVFYGNRIYLFSSEESLQAFSKQPAQYESAFQRASQASRARSYR